MCCRFFAIVMVTGRTYRPNPGTWEEAIYFEHIFRHRLERPYWVHTNNSLLCQSLPTRLRFLHSPKDCDIEHGSCAGLAPVRPSPAASSSWAWWWKAVRTEQTHRPLQTSELYKQTARLKHSQCETDSAGGRWAQVAVVVTAAILLQTTSVATMKPNWSREKSNCSGKPAGLCCWWTLSLAPSSMLPGPTVCLWSGVCPGAYSIFTHFEYKAD